MASNLLRHALALARELLARDTLSTAEARGLLDGNPRSAVRRALRVLEAEGWVERLGAGGETRYRVRRPAGAPAVPKHPTDVELLAQVLGNRVLDHLRGTDLPEWAESGRNKLEELADARTIERARVLSSRFLLHEEPPRRFEGMGEQFDDALTAVLRDHEISLVHDGRRLEGLHPYALVLYRRALYVVGRVRGEGPLLRIPLDRAEDLRRHRSRRFVRPEGASHVEEIHRNFGIREGGPPASVRLRFQPRVARYVRARDWHPTARTRTLDDGGVELEMFTAGEELVRFCLEWGETVEVLEPPWLRERVVAELRGALAQYDRGECSASGRDGAARP